MDGCGEINNLAMVTQLPGGETRSRTQAALSGWPLGHGALLILDHNAGSAVARVEVFYLYSEKMETAMRFQEGNVVRGPFPSVCTNNRWSTKTWSLL